ncbi:putative ATP-grasp-modified RiPP [Actinosynnema mirum]|uniref:Uncharacterized protein n=1 Tax=Actinosynnema mirum (strain ATCC 29888 / DSM 43827 / JCM 3225 / NBRC 14064 / NCIMB 13271 / NRRL B-12336 / IMRU 3971 / 101) TaxID=446462 RepID=C6WF32_ACTMD|nr:putative ATP-grasp-modified RiPP [Actinosynnema mirum]ACU34164.1 hypothetical protein Amir_0193 [Actinosynnema mirum DSM 43827]
MADLPGTLVDTNPLSSSQLRNTIRAHAVSTAPGPDETRPFGLRFAVTVPTPVRRTVSYCPTRQLAVDNERRPLIETMGKEWATKGSTDGDEGPEENWGWEE